MIAKIAKLKRIRKSFYLIIPNGSWLYNAKVETKCTEKSIMTKYSKTNENKNNLTHHKKQSIEIKKDQRWTFEKL